MSCETCTDSASAKISIGKGSLLLCKSCYSHINASSVGASVATSAEPEGYVHIHKDSEEFAGLQFLASHLGEHFATILELPHNDLNRYKSTVKEAHYILPLRVVHPIANGLGLIGMPNGRKRQLATDDTGDDDGPDAQRLRTNDPSPPSSPDAVTPLSLTSTATPPSSPSAATPPSGTSAATPETQSIFLPLPSRTSVATPPSGTSAATPSSLVSTVTPSPLASAATAPPTGTGAATSSSLTSVATLLPLSADYPSFWEFRRLPPEAIAEILSVVDLRAFLNMISSSITTRDPATGVIRIEHHFDFAAVTAKTFCRVLGNTNPIQFEYLETSSARFDALLTQLKSEKEIFRYIFWLFDERSSIAIQLTTQVQKVEKYNTAYLAATNKQRREILEKISEIDYIPVLKKAHRWTLALDFTTFHADIRNAILKRWCQLFDFSTWRRPIMLQWLNIIIIDFDDMISSVNSSISTSALKAISSICSFLINYRILFRGPFTASYVSKQTLRLTEEIHNKFILPSAVTYYDTAYDTVVDILKVLFYWCSPSDLAQLFSQLAKNELDINDRSNSLVVAALSLVDETLLRHTNQMNAERTTIDTHIRQTQNIMNTETNEELLEVNATNLQLLKKQLQLFVQEITINKLDFCELLFTGLMPCSNTVTFYMTTSDKISLRGCDNAIAALVDTLNDVEDDIYDLRIDAITAMMGRLSSDTTDIAEIISNTNLFNDRTHSVNSFNATSSILSCVTNPAKYIPASQPISHIPQRFELFMGHSRIPAMQTLCWRMLRKIQQGMPDFHPERAMLLQLSKQCETYLFLLNNFLRYTLATVTIDIDTMFSVLENALGMVKTYQSNPQIYTHAMENLSELLNTLPVSTVELILKRARSHVIITPVVTMGNTVGSMSVFTTLQRVFSRVDPAVLNFAVAKYYIYEMNNPHHVPMKELEDALRALFTANDLRSYSQLFGEYIYYLIKEKQSTIMMFVVQEFMSIQLEENDAKNADVLITLLKRYSFSKALELCIILTGSNLIMRNNITHKYTIHMSTAETYKLAMAYMEGVSSIVTYAQWKYFDNWPIMKLVPISVLPEKDWNAIRIVNLFNAPTQSTVARNLEIPFIAALNLRHAIIYMKAHYSVTDELKRRYARTLTEAMKFWLMVDEFSNAQPSRILEFMREWNISPIVSLDQYSSEGVVVTDLFDASWLKVLINNRPSLRLNVIVALYAYMTQVDLKELEQLSNVQFDEKARNTIMADKFYEHYGLLLCNSELPKDYEKGEKKNRLFVDEVTITVLCEFVPRRSISAIIKLLQREYSTEQLQRGKVVPWNNLDTMMVRLIIPKMMKHALLSLDNYIGFFNECIGNAVTLIFIQNIPNFTRNFAVLVTHPAAKFALHEIMNSITAVIDNVDALRLISPVIVEVDSFLNGIGMLYELFMLQSPKHGNQTLAHLWLKSLFYLRINYNNLILPLVITNFIERCGSEMLIRDDYGQTPIDVFNYYRTRQKYENVLPNAVEETIKQRFGLEMASSAALPMPPAVADAPLLLSSSTPSLAAAAAAAAPPTQSSLSTFAPQ